LTLLSRNPCRTSTDAAIRVSATILEVIQGPCKKNQEHLALNTDLLETLNRILRSKPQVNDCRAEDELELKCTCVDIYLGLLEGQGKKSAVYDRVLSVLHFDIILSICYPPETTELQQQHQQQVGTAPAIATASAAAPLSEGQLELKTQCLVLIEMLCDYRPTLRKDLMAALEVTHLPIPSNVGCIEVMWEGVLQRRFFNIPSICADLAKSSKDRLIEEVKRDSPENKVLDFMDRAIMLYREILHQQELKRLHLNSIFSITNKDRATWISFFLSCVANVLYLVFYSIDFSDGSLRLADEVSLAIQVINVFLIIFSGFTLVLVLVVNTPVLYNTYIDEGMDYKYALVYSVFDNLTLYYMLYLTIVLLGYLVDNYFTSFLLLDIVVKNATARNVLNAVVRPRFQILMTVILGLFLVYIFAFYFVSLYLQIYINMTFLLFNTLLIYHYFW
jgi:hypothetical protein